MISHSLSVSFVEKSAKCQLNVLLSEMNEEICFNGSYCRVLRCHVHVRVLNECEFSLHDLLSVFPIKLLCFFLHSGLKAHFVVKLPIIPFRLHLV